MKEYNYQHHRGTAPLKMLGDNAMEADCSEQRGAACSVIAEDDPAGEGAYAVALSPLIDQVLRVQITAWTALSSRLHCPHARRARKRDGLRRSSY